MNEIDILVEDLLAYAKTLPADPKPDYPDTHEAGMRVPKGGSSCASCEYLGEDRKSCTNKYFIKWNGSGELPLPADEYCSDWYSPEIDLDAAVEELVAYGTSEGVKKEWDTRGRGRKPRPLGAPRMRNRIQRERPHDPKSAIGQVMDMAQRKEGVRVDEAKEFLKNAGVRLWVLSFVRKGEGNGFRWQVIDDGKKSGTIRVGKPEKIPDEELAQKKEEPEQTVLGTPDSSKSEVHLITTPISDSHELGGGVNESKIVDFSDGKKGVFKPDPDSEAFDLSNIPGGLTTEREVAAWQVAKLVGMDDMVSPAVIRTIDGQRGALLEWQDGDVANRRAGDAKYDGDADAERAAIFDFVIGNEDRHSGNWVVSGEGKNAKLHLIDHGLSFPEGEWNSGNTTMFVTHLKIAEDGSDKPPNAGIVSKYVAAAPMISGTLKHLGFNSEVIQGVDRRILTLKNAKDWDHVDERGA